MAFRRQPGATLGANNEAAVVIGPDRTDTGVSPMSIVQKRETQTVEERRVLGRDAR